MPVHVTCDHALRLVTFTFQGTVTIDEWAEALASQVGDDAWSYGTLIDATAPGIVLPTLHNGDDIPRYVDGLVSELGARGRVAFACATPELVEHLNAYRASRTLPYRYEIFRHPMSARAWLLADVHGAP